MWSNSAPLRLPELICNGHRFNIYENYGCLPTTWRTPVAIPIVYLPPLIVNLITVVYGCKILRAPSALRELTQTFPSSTNGPRLHEEAKAISRSRHCHWLGLEPLLSSRPVGSRRFVLGPPIYHLGCRIPGSTTLPPMDLLGRHSQNVQPRRPVLLGPDTAVSADAPRP